MVASYLQKKNGSFRKYFGAALTRAPRVIIFFFARVIIFFRSEKKNMTLKFRRISACSREKKNYDPKTRSSAREKKIMTQKLGAEHAKKKL